MSAYTAEHEMLHMKLWYKMTPAFPEMTEQLAKLNKLQHEEYVLAEFMKSADKWPVTDLEKDLATIK